jgi:hypothetical protein
MNERPHTDWFARYAGRDPRRLAGLTGMEIQMSKSRTLPTVTLGLVIAAVLPGCATFEKCRFNGCPGDAQTTANVKALFDQHSELGTSINVQTLDHVVYLYGLVDTPLESEIAKSVALEAPGAARVVSTIANGN